MQLTGVDLLHEVEHESVASPTRARRAWQSPSQMKEYRAIMNAESKWIRLRPCRTLVVGLLAAGALTGVIGVGSAEQPPITYPFHECAKIGRCASASSVCGGPGSYGQACRYCTISNAVEDCQFTLVWVDCLSWFDNSGSDYGCGLEMVGICTAQGCAGGVPTGNTCSRSRCATF